MAKYLVTGGAGFIGCNLCKYLLKSGQAVIVIDNLSRKGTESNLNWLKQIGKFQFVNGDIRNATILDKICKKNKDIKGVFHLAAQVAVTTSVVNPREDFEINALGTFNVLEAVRKYMPDSIVLYASTNKVYGGMEDVKIKKLKTRYTYRDFPNGVSEDRILDFHSPYGCSKGTGDQYVRDYNRIYGIKTIVSRQSCIYGYRQFGIEDQGWVAWFIIASVLNKPITIYGDGLQVRDVLFIDDLIRCYMLAIKNIKKTGGQVYNIGGGPKNVISVWKEFAPKLEKLLGRKIPVKYSDWRPGDQPVFICDISKAKKDFGWSPKITVDEGITKLVNWVIENKEEIARYF